MYRIGPHWRFRRPLISRAAVWVLLCCPPPGHLASFWSLDSGWPVRRYSLAPIMKLSLTRLLLPCLLTSSALAGPVGDWYVDGAVAGPGSGTLADPFASIGFAMAQPSTLSGDRVLVAGGVYVGETLDFLGKNLRLEAIDGIGTVTVQGPGMTIQDMAHAPGSGGRALVRVVSGEGAGTAIQSFRIVGGLGEDRGADGVGGAIYVNGSTLALEDCEIQGKADRWGGAVACLDGELNCVNT